MENYPEVLATKRAWRNAERQKDGTPEDRKALADTLRAGRQHTQPKKSLWKWLFPMVLLFIIQGNANAYTASWYGANDTIDPWKHTTTANGERFNENALTAASWKYPMGTKILVTNIKNGKSVIVRINDRGPGKHLYKKGRIVDLTKGAFMKIADLKDGVIKIKVKRILITVQ